MTLRNTTTGLTATAGLQPGAVWPDTGPLHAVYRVSGTAAGWTVGDTVTLTEPP